MKKIFGKEQTMGNPSQTGPIEKRWEYIKNYRYKAQFIALHERVHDEDVELHDHPSLTHKGFRFELAYILDGEATSFTENSRFHVKKGDFIMVDAPTRHGFDLKRGEPIKVINITFDYNAIDHVAGTAKNFTEIAKQNFITGDLSPSKAIDDLVIHDDDGSIYGLIMSIKKEYEDNLPGFQGVIKARLAELVLLGLRKYFCKSTAARYSPAVQKIVEYMEYGYMSNITLSNFSKELGIPLRLLSLQFKNEVGMTYTEYVQRRRITESCNLISSANESIEFISEVVGYSDTKKFRKKFKEYVGMTPREYKKSLQKV